MRVVQAVFGVFHHFELAHQLHRRHHLTRIYSTWPWARLKREGLPRDLVGTFPLLHTAEYLLGRSRLASPGPIARLASWNTRSFDRWTNLHIPPCDAFIAISGAGLLTGRTVQQRGGKFLCDRGSTHQRYQETVLREEHRRWGLPAPFPKPHITLREETIYALADAITVPSTVALRSFLAMGVPEDKLHVLPYGVRLDRFHPSTPPPRDSFEVLFAGSVSLRKGVPYLLEAFAQLQHPRKHLTLVGSVQPEIRSLLARLPTTLPTDNVTFTGSIPQPLLAERMSASHVLVLPSIEEGLALVQAQAMACGCPVLATPATGAEDLFRDGVEGFLVPERDPAALATRLQQLADDPDLREAMSERALQRVQHLGGWDHYGEQWDRLLHRLTGIAPDPSETGETAQTAASADAAAQPATSSPGLFTGPASPRASAAK
jgi:alpha-maltose-1-phosphate synthase